MSKNQFTGKITQPQRNRKVCQFNNDQYCTIMPIQLRSRSDTTKAKCLILILQSGHYGEEAAKL